MPQLFIIGVLFLASANTVLAQESKDSPAHSTRQEVPVDSPQKNAQRPPSPDNKEHVPDCRNTVSVNSHFAASCYAGSKIQDGDALGGFGKSENFPRDVSSAAASALTECYLLAEPNVPTELGVFRGMRLVLVNPTDATKGFDASDSCLYLFQEAKNGAGEWEQLDSMIESDCGNSFHRVFLAKKQFWEFPVFRFDGDVRTKLRFKLTDGSGQTVLTSNVFDGGISNTQFKPKKQPKDGDNGR